MQVEGGEGEWVQVGGGEGEWVQVEGGEGWVWRDLLGGPSSPGRLTTPRGRAGVLGMFIGGLELKNCTLCTVQS